MFDALRRRWFVPLGAALVLVAVVAAIGLSEPRTYTATASFVPQQRPNNIPPNLSGLAAQIGMTLPTADVSESPAFYADLLASRGILGHVVDTAYVLPNAAAPFSAADWLGRRERDAARRRDLALVRLRQRVVFASVTRTGIVNVAVRTESPHLSVAMLSHLLAEVGRYNLATRQSRAGAERQFAEERLANAERALRSAEFELQSFLERNRTYANSPQLTFQHDRLQRSVAQHQQIRNSLAETVERARIEEVRDTPVLSFIDTPELPARPDPRGLLLRVLAAGLFGAVAGAAVVLALAGARAAQRSAAPLHESDVTGEARASPPPPVGTGVVAEAWKNSAPSARPLTAPDR